jgi:hypothetical protein
MEGFIKEIGRIISSKEKDMRSSTMVQFILETIKKVNHKDSEDMHGLMERSIRVNGSMDSKMVQAFGGVLKEIPTLVSGKTVRQTGMEFILGLMVIVIKANSRTVLSMARAYRNLVMVIAIKEITRTESHTDMDSIIGAQEATLKETSRMDYEKVKDCGKKVLAIAIDTKVSIRMTRKKARAFSHGQMGMFTKVNMQMI